MTEAMILRLLDFGLTALSVGIERQAILDRVAALQKEGATPEQLVDGLRQMRDAAIAKAEEASK